MGKALGVVVGVTQSANKGNTDNTERKSEFVYTHKPIREFNNFAAVERRKNWLEFFLYTLR